MFKNINKLNLLSRANNFKILPKTQMIYKAQMRPYNQVKDLHQTMMVAELEEIQRKEKFLEYTQKVYKPSKTITFDRNGEVLLFSCDNFKNSQVYLKYPYCMYDSMIPLAFYIFFADPCKNFSN
jgi:hypothetical protein